MTIDFRLNKTALRKMEKEMAKKIRKIAEKQLPTGTRPLVTSSSPWRNTKTIFGRVSISDYRCRRRLNLGRLSICASD